MRISGKQRVSEGAARRKRRASKLLDIRIAVPCGFATAANPHEIRITINNAKIVQSISAPCLSRSPEEREALHTLNPGPCCADTAILVRRRDLSQIEPWWLRDALRNLGFSRPTTTVAFTPIKNETSTRAVAWRRVAKAIEADLCNTSGYEIHVDAYSVTNGIIVKTHEGANIAIFNVDTRAWREAACNSLLAVYTKTTRGNVKLLKPSGDSVPCACCGVSVAKGMLKRHESSARHLEAIAVALASIRNRIHEKWDADKLAKLGVT